MPRSRTTNQAAGTTLNQGTNGPVPTRQRITRRRTARGAQGKNLGTLSGGMGNQRFAGMSSQAIYNLGVTHGEQLHGKGITR